ncbi:uncharacterized protein LOC128654724 [Bombina bombina]|uniref:uncharacterized protein LOC128654724 n=1 Tax=Bombina bombina TaxID=8345 RepID=UPI00235A512D|nr:uncharacterized protein LOC128654724 [Bombina bombina]
MSPPIAPQKRQDRMMQTEITILVDRAVIVTGALLGLLLAACVSQALMSQRMKREVSGASYHTFYEGSMTVPYCTTWASCSIPFTFHDDVTCLTKNEYGSWMFLTKRERVVFELSEEETITCDIPSSTVHCVTKDFCSAAVTREDCKESKEDESWTIVLQDENLIFELQEGVGLICENPSMPSTSPKLKVGIQERILGCKTSTDTQVRAVMLNISYTDGEPEGLTYVCKYTGKESSEPLLMYIRRPVMDGKLLNNRHKGKRDHARRHLGSLHASSWELDNTFVKTAKDVFNVTNVQGPCWVCGFVPHGQTRGYPYLGVSLTMSMLADMIGNKTVWNFTGLNTPGRDDLLDKLHLANNVTTGAIMFQNLDGEIYSTNNLTQLPDMIMLMYNIGRLVKNRTGVFNIKLKFYDFSYLTYAHEKWKTKFGEPRDLIKDWYQLNRETLAGNTRTKDGRKRLNRICPPFVKLPVGYYWLCGGWAVKVIPCTHYGPCFLGYIFPAFNITTTLPPPILHRTRRYLDLDKIHNGVKISEGMRLLATFVPHYGAATALTRLNTLADLVDEAFNVTRDAIELLALEQEQIRMVALQNRMALDYLLAAEGGVCQRIHQQCCVYIEDNTGKIKHDLHRLEEVQKHIREVHDDSFSKWLKDFDWTFGLGGWLGSLGQTIVKWLLISLACLCGIFIIVKMFGCFCNTLGRMCFKPKDNIT